MHRSPAIGIVAYERDAHDDGVFPREYFRLPAPYVDAVRMAGGIPLLIPPMTTHPSDLLDGFDGLLLAGGDDVSPLRYGEPKDPNRRYQETRDAFEIELTRAALKRDIPLLAICRGIQLVNVACGGTLHRHVPDAFPNGLDHRPYPTPPGNHAVSLETDSKLAAVLEETTFQVRSWHHQAVDRVGDGLRVVGRAPDGVIEAVEAPNHRWFIGVQWHPELDAPTAPVHQRLFTRFVAEAGRLSRERKPTR